MPSIKGVYLFLIIILIGVIFVGGCTQSSTPMTSSAPSISQTGNIQIKVDYSGKWQGAMGAGGNVKSISGSGPMTYDIQNPGAFVSINAQKMDDSTGRLTVSILKNGAVVKSEFTDAAYGLAMTSGAV